MARARFSYSRGIRIRAGRLTIWAISSCSASFAIRRIGGISLLTIAGGFGRSRMWGRFGERARVCSVGYGGI